MIRLSFIGSVLLSLLHRWWRPATIQCRHLRRMEAHGHPERAAWGRQPVRLVTAIPFCRPPTTIVCKAREYILRIHYFHLLDPQLLLLFGVDTSSGDSVNELLEGGIAYFTEYNTYHPHSAVCPCIFGKFAHSPIRGLIAVFEEIEIIGTGIH